jgi:hypothetical protein
MRDGWLIEMGGKNRDGCLNGWLIEIWVANIRDRLLI